MRLQVLKSFKTVTEEKENSQSVFLPDKLLHCCDQRGKQAGIAATDVAKARAFIQRESSGVKHLSDRRLGKTPP